MQDDAHSLKPYPGSFLMERSQIHRVSVADQVASILRQRILNGELRPETPQQEVPLAASLGVSRNTMREATRILSLENLLKRSTAEWQCRSSPSKMSKRSTTFDGCWKFQ